MKQALRAFVAGLVLGAAHCAHAQARPTASGPGSNISIGGGASIFQADYGQRNLGGGLIYADVNPTWRIGFEGEARYLRTHTNEDVTESNYLVGIKVAARSSRIQPYGKFLVGAGRITLPFNYAQGTFFTYAPGAGVDYLLTDRLTIRAIDFEYQSWPGFSFGELRPYGISTGISFRLNGIDRLPSNAHRMSRH
jgi:opacity protein-like surface antigen